MDDIKARLTAFILNVFPMPPEKVTSIVEYFKERSYNRNELVLKEGRVCNEYAFLDKGFMRAWTTDLEGKDVTTAFYPTGNIVCELFSFFKRTPSKENIQALTGCTCMYITYSDLQHVFHAMPEFREFGRSILVNAYVNLKQRMLSGLHETAEQRYKNMILTAPDILLHASLKHIASYLGVTDTSLSRIRKEFSRDL